MATELKIAYKKRHKTKRKISPSIRVFYNLYVPCDQERVEIVQNIVIEQVKKLAESRQKYDVQIISIGVDIDAVKICEIFDITCTVRTRVPSGREGLSLNAVLGYCKVHPKKLVIYMHDKGSEHNRGPHGNTRLRHFLMQAVTSENCLEMPEYCNTCGAHFSPLPYAAFHGNMWVARCDYIQKLVPVNHLQASLREIQDKFEPTPQPNHGWDQTTGVDQPREYDGIPAKRPVSEYWLASHPDLKPCDLYDSQRKPAWVIKNTPNPGWKEELAKAPRYEMRYYIEGRTNLSWPNYKWQRNLKNKLILWNYTYNREPEADSWVWKYYL